MDTSQFVIFVTITGFNHYIIRERLAEGTSVLLVREHCNQYDKYAVAAYLKSGKIGYVANSTATVSEGTLSAKQLSEFMEDSAKAEIVEFTSYNAVCRVKGVLNLDKMCLKAFEIFNACEYASALELFLILNNKYNSLLLKQYIADCLIKLGRFEESLSYTEAVLKDERDNEVSIMMRGSAMLNLGYYEEAISDFSVLLEKRENADILRERAICYSKLNENKKALKDIERSLKLNPKNPITLKVNELLKK